MINFPINDLEVSLSERLFHDVRIIKDSKICNGKAHIKDTRVPIFLLAKLWRQRKTDADILDTFSSLTYLDLQVAWKYIQDNPEEIELDTNKLPVKKPEPEDPEPWLYKGDDLK